MQAQNGIFLAVCPLQRLTGTEGYLFRPKRNHTQGREGQFSGKSLVVPLGFDGHYAAHISDVAAAVNSSITVEHFAPFAGAREANAIMFAWHGSEIEDDREFMRAVRELSHKRQSAAVLVGAIDPVKAAVIKVRLP